jgi:hypothetical protein
MKFDVRIARIFAVCAQSLSHGRVHTSIAAAKFLISAESTSGSTPYARDPNCCTTSGGRRGCEAKRRALATAIGFTGQDFWQSLRAHCDLMYSMRT